MIDGNIKPALPYCKQRWQLLAGDNGWRGYGCLVEVGASATEEISRQRDALPE